MHAKWYHKTVHLHWSWRSDYIRPLSSRRARSRQCTIQKCGLWCCPAMATGSYYVDLDLGHFSLLQTQKKMIVAISRVLVSVSTHMIKWEKKRTFLCGLHLTVTLGQIKCVRICKDSKRKQAMSQIEWPFASVIHYHRLVHSWWCTNPWDTILWIGKKQFWI